MKTQRWKILTTLGWLASSVLGLAVVETTSETFVATATVIKGYTGVGDGWVTYFSLPTVGPVVAGGSVTAVGSTALVDTNANWQTDVIQRGAMCYIEFDSGMMADIVSLNGATHTINLYGPVPSGISAGLAYRIRQHRTINDVFGATNSVGLKPGTPTSGDNVILQDPETQLSYTFFYFPLSNAWCQRLTYNVPSGDTRIYPEQGIMVKRKLSNDVVLCLHGEAKTGPSQLTIYPGWNLVGTLFGNRTGKLSELNLYTGNVDTGIVGGSLSSGDRIYVVQPDKTTVLYYYTPGVGWRTPNTGFVGDASIPPGTAFFIERRASPQPFLWTLPPEQ